MVHAAVPLIRTSWTIRTWSQLTRPSHSRLRCGSGWPRNRPSRRATRWSLGHGRHRLQTRQPDGLQGLGLLLTLSMEVWSVGMDRTQGLLIELGFIRDTVTYWMWAMETTWTATARPTFKLDYAGHSGIKSPAERRKKTHVVWYKIKELNFNYLFGILNMWQGILKYTRKMFPFILLKSCLCSCLYPFF